MTVGDGGQPPAQWAPPQPSCPSPAAPPPAWRPDTSWQQGPSAPPPGQQYAWTPPPKPGLIPLRPLTLGTVLGASFRVLRRNPRPMLGTTLLLYGGFILVFLLVVSGVAVWGYQRITSASSDDREAVTVGTLGLGALALLLPTGASVLVQSLVEGLVALEVARGTLGEKLSTRALLRTAPGRIGPVIGWAFAMTGASLAAILLTTVAITLIIVAGGTVGLVVGILLAILAGLGALVLTLWLGTKLSFVPSALLVERLTLGRAIRRSWSLTRGIPTFWKVLGIEALVSAIVSAGSNVVTQPLSFIGGILGGFLDPSGEGDTSLYVLGGTVLVTYAVGFLVSSVGVVIRAATSALLYIDLRMRREGLDLELIRYVEARQVGDTSVTDPYLPPRARSTAA